MRDIQYVAQNIKLSKDFQKYARDKIAKHEALLERALAITILVRLNRNDHGGKRNIKVEILVDVPNAFIKVEGRGQNPKAIIDKLEVLLKRRLKRYRDQYKRWNKEEPWKVQDLFPQDDSSAMTAMPALLNYEPQIKRKTYENDRPIHPAEAVEQMELLGHNCFLFKNIETGKYAMIYKRSEVGYGLVEPKF